MTSVNQISTFYPTVYSPCSDCRFNRLMRSPLQGDIAGGG
jgi:hypothetical protein